MRIIKLRQHNREQQKGFTLVELLLAMALMGSFMVTLTSIFSSVLTVQSEAQATSSVTQDGRFILARLSYDIQRASAINTPPTLGATRTQLDIDIAGVSNNYSISNGNLELNNSNGTSNLNGSETTVSNFSVTLLGNSGDKETIRVTFTVTSVAQDNAGQRTQTFTTTVGRR